MSSIKTRDIRRNLTKKGFSENDKKDHIWLNYIDPDGNKTTVRTKISHGKEDIGDPLISAMAKQAHISKRQFIELVTCTLSGEEYYNIVKDTL